MYYVVEKRRQAQDSKQPMENDILSFPVQRARVLANA